MAIMTKAKAMAATPGAGNKNFIKVTHYGQETAIVAGEKRLLAEMTEAEVEDFNFDFETLLNISNQFNNNVDLVRLLEKNVDIVFDTVRAEKILAESGYEGRLTTGNGLMMDLLTPMMFGAAAGAQYIWQQAAVQNVMLNWIDHPTVPTTQFDLERRAAVVIVGQYLPPGSNGNIGGVNLIKMGKTLNGWTVDSDAYPIMEYPAPLVAVGQETFMINHYPVLTGNDVWKPWGIGIFPANRVRPISNISPLRNV